MHYFSLIHTITLVTTVVEKGLSVAGKGYHTHAKRKIQHV